MGFAKTRSVRAGFSLMEIMIVITIIGLLVAMIGPRIAGQLASAQKNTARTTMKTLRDSVKMFKMHTGQYPQKLNDLVKKPKDLRGWDGPYGVDEDNPELPQDPWHNDFKYKVTPGAKHPFELYSTYEDKPKEEWISVWDEK